LRTEVGHKGTKTIEVEIGYSVTEKPDWFSENELVDIIDFNENLNIG